jgi:hypothetical protein
VSLCKFDIERYVYQMCGLVWICSLRIGMECMCVEGQIIKDENPFKFICIRIKKRRKTRVKIVTLKLCGVWKSRYI